MAYQEGSEPQELLEKQQSGSSISTTTREKIENVEQKVLGTQLHRKFEILDPILEKHAGLIGGILILTAVIVAGVILFKKRKKI